ncbi:MAG TPA: hypothetical protein VF520_00550 [Thermoleophilaceae bacterium]|jgi:hypothetical protein
MLHKKILILAVAAASLALALPSVAAARPGGGREGRSARGAQGLRGDVPSRVASRVRRARRALERAEDRIDDGENAGAVASLASVRKNLATALEAAGKRISADNGPASFRAVTSTHHAVVDGTVGMFDGVDDGAVVDALATTLKASLDGRDQAVDSIAALSDDDREAYGAVLDSISDQTGDELEAIDEALADDTLTAEARSALSDSKAQAEATRTEVQGLGGGSASASASSEDEDGASDEGRRRCRDRNGSDEGSDDGGS